MNDDQAVFTTELDIRLWRDDGADVLLAIRTWPEVAHWMADRFASDDIEAATEQAVT